MAIRFWGNSDDQMYVGQDGASKQHAGDHARFVVVDRDQGGILVDLRYAVEEGVGAWTIGLAQIGDEIPCPWPVRVENATTSDAHAPRPDNIGGQHSLVCVIDCPPGTPVEKQEGTG
jgi:hypothetical protein